MVQLTVYMFDVERNYARLWSHELEFDCQGQKERGSYVFLRKKKKRRKKYKFATIELKTNTILPTEINRIIKTMYKFTLTTIQVKERKGSVCVFAFYLFKENKRRKKKYKMDTLCHCKSKYN